MSNYPELVLSFATVFLSAGLSYITARLTSQKEYKKTVLETVYKNIVFPIYNIIYDDIELFKKCPSYEPSQSEIENIQAKIMDVLKNSSGTYTHKFYRRCVDLSSSNFKDYCEYIERNYNDCVSSLDYYLPYGYFGKDKQRARMILALSTVLLLLCYLLLFSGLTSSTIGSKVIVGTMLFSMVVAISTANSV